jgi:hypothetical protein
VNVTALGDRGLGILAIRSPLFTSPTVHGGVLGG